MRRPPPLDLSSGSLAKSKANEDKTGLTKEQKELIVNFLNEVHAPNNRQNWQVAETCIQFIGPPQMGESPGPAINRATGEVLSGYYGSSQYETDITTKFSDEFLAELKPESRDNFIKNFADSIKVEHSGSSSCYSIDHPVLLQSLFKLAQERAERLYVLKHQDEIESAIQDIALQGNYGSIKNIISKQFLLGNKTAISGTKKDIDTSTDKKDNEGPKGPTA